jgi:hypothetical protein
VALVALGRFVPLRSHWNVTPIMRCNCTRKLAEPPSMTVIFVGCWEMTGGPNP